MSDPNPSLALVSEVEELYFGAALARGPRSLIIYPESRGEPSRLSYAELLVRARGAAEGFAASGAIQPDEPFLLLASSDAETAAAFLGGVLYGALPVPISPPMGLGGLDAWTERLGRVQKALGITGVVGSADVLGLLGDALPTVDVATLPLEGPGRPGGGLGPSHVQLTSGSTGDAKGVLITHENCQANLYHIGWRSDVRADDVVVSWLPLFHDMGLVGALLFSIYWNLDLALLPPVAFLTRPVRWLEAIDRHRGSLSPAPTFAFSYLAHRLRKGVPEGLDLSSWRIAYCGAEPVRRDAVQGFLDAFAGNGLDPGVLLPCYGLAEATLAVTFVPWGRPLRSERVSRAGLAAEQVRSPRDDNDAQEVVLLGGALPEVEIELRDKQGAPCPADGVGSVWLRGPTITPGYYRNEAATNETRDANGWLETGDVGCWIDGELALIGREKDLIIVRGANHSPTSLEWAAEAIDGVRSGSVAAFASYDAKNATEGAVIALEVAADESDWSRGAIRIQVEEVVLQRTGLRVLDVVLLGPGTIPKTTSGKVRRGAVRGLYLDGAFDV